MILVVLLLATGVASAGRKRVVVLELEGPKGEKFHGDLVKLIKKSHTVVALDKWNHIAEDLSASSLSPANIKKVAKKLKVDGVISGTVDKRRDQYILKLKLHAGTSGKVVGDVNTKSEDARLDATSRGDIQDELLAAIAGLDSNRGGGGGDDDEEAEPPKKNKRVAEAEDDSGDEDEGARKPKGFGRKRVSVAEDEAAKKPKKSKKSEDDAPATASDEEDDNPLPKPKKRPKSRNEDEGDDVASRDGDEDGGEISDSGDVAVDPVLARSPGERAVDAVVGISFTARRMSFNFDPNMTTKPPGYKGNPVAGGMIDATVYPLAFGHKRRGLLKNLGLTLLYDQVFAVSSKTSDGTTLSSSESRWAIGGAFRYPFNESPTSPVIGLMLRYGRQKFTISGNSGVPNVHYTMIEPVGFFKWPLSTKATLNLSAGFIGVSDTGAIQKMDEYGPATVTGFEGEVSGDYLITGSLFMRAALRAETFGYNFKGGAARSTGVAGARDSYLGGAITAGYLF
ncbi:MAG: hypothetical protein ACTHU0_01705 [Kofleriaceae bacterium]